MTRQIDDKTREPRRSEPRRSPWVREVSRGTPTRDTPYYYCPPLHLLSSETHNLGFLPLPRLLWFSILGCRENASGSYRHSRSSTDEGRRAA